MGELAKRLSEICRAPAGRVADTLSSPGFPKNGAPPGSCHLREESAVSVYGEDTRIEREIPPDEEQGELEG